MQNFHVELNKHSWKIVSCRHIRPFNDKEKKIDYKKHCALTEVFIQFEEHPDRLFFGRSFCSNKDYFNKKKGRTIAIGRALKLASEIILKGKLELSYFYPSDYIPNHIITGITDLDFIPENNKELKV